MNPTFANPYDLFQASTPRISPNYRPGALDLDDRDALIERSEDARYQYSHSFLSARMALLHDIAQFSSRQPMKTADHRSFRQMRSDDELGFYRDPFRFADIRNTQQLFAAAPVQTASESQAEGTAARIPSRLRSERRPRPVAVAGESPEQTSPADREPVRHGTRRDILLAARHLPFRGRKIMRQPVLAEDDVLELPAETAQQKAEAAGKPRW